MPDKYRVQLNYIESASYSGTTFNNVLYGVSGTGARIPKYWGNYFSIYKYAYIDAVHFKFEIVNIGTRPGTIALAEGNTIDSVSVNMEELARTPRALYKTSVIDGNHSVVNMSYTARAAQIMGHKLDNDEQYWTRESTGPTAPVLPVMVLGWQPLVTGTTFDVSWTLRIRYDLSFFSINPQ
jgi:hypothetical protein